MAFLVTDDPNGIRVDGELFVPVERLHDAAKDVLLMAASGGMPDAFWATDQRIKRACEVLYWDPVRARSWAQENAENRVMR